MFAMRNQCLAVLLFAMLGGCATTTPYYDARFGDAVNAAKAQQTANPNASRNADPVAGIAGTPAKLSIDEYQNTFKAPASTFEIFVSPAAAQQ